MPHGLTPVAPKLLRALRVSKGTIHPCPHGQGPLDSRRLEAPPGEQSEREGEAPSALPVEGATRAPIIEIYDTTLRDGTQSEDIAFTVEDKLRIAEKLDELGVHYIEGGWPGSNPKDNDFFRYVGATHRGRPGPGRHGGLPLRLRDVHSEYHHSARGSKKLRLSRECNKPVHHNPCEAAKLRDRLLPTLRIF